jgi:hypothetical protein
LFGSQPDLVGSFLAQSDERFHAGSAPCRNVAREKRDARKNGRNEKKGDRIGWPNPEKHGPENSRLDRSSDQPRSQSDHNNPHAFSQPEE